MLKQQEEIDRLKAQLSQNVLHIPDPLQMAQSLSNTVSHIYKFSTLSLSFHIYVIISIIPNLLVLVFVSRDDVSVVVRIIKGSTVIEIKFTHSKCFLATGKKILVYPMKYFHD